MTGRGLVALGALTIATSGLIALRTTAAAQPLDLRATAVGVQQVTVGEDSAIHPLVVSRLAPGTTVTARFEVHRATRVTGGAFAAQVEHVEDLENGCGHSEAADGDTTCGPASGLGELSTELVVEQHWSAPSPDCSGTSAPSHGTTLAMAEGSPVTASAPTSSGDTACLTLQVALPSAADNLVQSDISRFALRIGLLGARHDGDLTGGGGTVSGLGEGQLPSTGLDAAARLTVAALMLLVGGALVLTGRQRPSS